MTSTVNIVPLNNGLDWGTFAAAADLPNASGSANIIDEVVMSQGMRAYVTDVGPYIVTSVSAANVATWALEASTNGTASAYTPSDNGDWQGSVPATVGAALDTLADTSRRHTLGCGQETAAAAQTDNVININGCTAIPMVRAGSITGFRVTLSAAAADDTIDVSIQKSGVTVGATTLNFAAAGVTTNVVTLDVGVSTFVATDTLRVVYTSGAALSNTPVITATVEIAT